MLTEVPMSNLVCVNDIEDRSLYRDQNVLKANGMYFALKFKR